MVKSIALPTVWSIGSTMNGIVKMPMHTGSHLTAAGDLITDCLASVHVAALTVLLMTKPGTNTEAMNCQTVASTAYFTTSEFPTCFLCVLYALSATSQRQ